MAQRWQYHFFQRGAKAQLVQRVQKDHVVVVASVFHKPMSAVRTLLVDRRCHRLFHMPFFFLQRMSLGEFFHTFAVSIWALDPIRGYCTLSEYSKYLPEKQDITSRRGD